MIGSVKWFSREKGFGFLTDGTKDYFAHYKSIKGTGFKNLVEGQKVEFNTAKTPKGESAVDIVVIE
jgi:CspA family cold shock protein